MTPDQIPQEIPSNTVGILFTSLNAILITLFYLLGKLRQDAATLASKERQEKTDEELRLAKGRAEIAAEHARIAAEQAVLTARKVEQAQKERTVQIADVKAGLKTLQDTVEQKHQETLAVVHENNVISNGYNEKIAGAVEQSRQLREDFQNGAPPKMS